MNDFNGKSAVVTGAAQGIGLAIAKRFQDAGASVVAFDRNGTQLEGVVRGLGERCIGFVGDVASRDDCRGAVDLCVERFGGLDVMCAHAGIAEPLPLLEMTEEHLQRHLDVNVKGTLLCTVEAAKAMVAGNRGGAIVCTSSINAWFVEETHAVYNITKAAVSTFVRSAAMDLARHGIRVNGVAPGVVDTPLAELVVSNPELARKYLQTIPLGRFGQPTDVAACVLFLASDEASYVTGQTLVIDGGQALGILGDLGDAAASTGRR
jgi:glucose 1-dehydrogenase